MMLKLFNNVKTLVKAELDLANEQHPLFASNHEAYAVIHEEVEEANDEDLMIKYYDGLLWRDVKEDDDVYEDADKIKLHAMRCACECIQVAAMCEKIKLKNK